MLQIIMATLTSLTLQWNAPRDGSGFVAGYDIRYSQQVITTANWDSATQAGGPTVLPPGALQMFTINNLQPHVKYYFAIKSVDNSGNWSLLSSIVMRETNIPPSKVGDLHERH